MKKILLALLVIISFFGYAFTIRAKGVIQKQEIPPTTIGIVKVGLAPTMTPVPPTPTLAVLQQKREAQSTATPQPLIPTATPRPSSPYKEGTYTGDVADAFYGNLQVQVIIANGRMSNIQFLQYPNDRNTSISINQQADPILAQEAIQNQSANVDIISGATDSSQAFIKSMQSALAKAKS